MENIYKDDYKEEKNRRRKFLLFVVLLSLVALTSLFIWTLSKYTTTSNLSDDANVAKFALNVPNSIELFSTSYDNVVSSDPEKNVVAPGTFGSFPFSVEGTSEVAYVVKADTSLVYSNDWNGYEPLEFSIDGDVWTSFSEFKENLIKELSSTTIPPNESYSDTLTIHWRWPFSLSETNDVKDTAMGDLASKGTAPKVTLYLTLSAEQVT